MAMFLHTESPLFLQTALSDSWCDSHFERWKQSEEGEHPDQAPTASKLQSQDQFPDLGNSFLFPGPLSLEEGIMENIH